MSNTGKLRCLVFVAVLLVCAALAWLAGYNFDERNGWVASCTALALFYAAIAASYPGIGGTRNE